MALIDPLALGDLGFAAAQFGSPSDWMADGGYLARLIAGQSGQLAARVGAGLYASPDANVQAQLRAAELHLCAAELWQRRAAAFDSATAASFAENRAAALVAEYRRCAEAERTLADAAIAGAGALAGVDLSGGGLACGCVESGPFPPLEVLA